MYIYSRRQHRKDNYLHLKPFRGNNNIMNLIIHMIYIYIYNFLLINSIIIILLYIIIYIYIITYNKYSTLNCDQILH